MAACCWLVGAACEDRVPEVVGVEVPLPPLLQEANRCARDFDCVDAGPYCPVSCHVLVGAQTPLAPDVAGLLMDSRDAVLEGQCLQDCSAPFWGATCQRGRCVARSSAPPRSICWDADGKPMDCAALLRRFGAESKCRQICGGRGSPGKREFQERVAIDDASHVTRRFVVDYLDCRDCP